MATTNHERVGKALELLRARLVRRWPEISGLARGNLPSRAGADQSELL